MIPHNYPEWRDCIVNKCGIPLTSKFIAERLSALTDKNNEHTQAFSRLYGEPYRQLVISWFRQAQSELK